MSIIPEMCCGIKASSSYFVMCNAFDLSTTFACLLTGKMIETTDH